MGNEASLDEAADDLADAFAEAVQLGGTKTKQPKQPTTIDPEIQTYRATAPPELIRAADWIQPDNNHHHKEKPLQKIIVVAGAGASTAAGIPDFRTPGTGLYDNLAAYDLPFPEAVFDLKYYARRPQAFVRLAAELWPTGQTYHPTLTHSFLTLLARKQKLLRVYTQNIDGLEHLAKLPTDLLVECHGHFRTASCIACGTAAPDTDAVRDTIVQQQQVPQCGKCHGYVKPDIVFFGEDLPARFHRLLREDLRHADACLILGTSLAVAPVSGIPDWVNRHAKRILWNRELVGNLKPRRHTGRDLFYGGDCDHSVEWVAKLLGWWPELQQMHRDLLQELSKSSQKGAIVDAVKVPPPTENAQDTTVDERKAQRPVKRNNQTNHDPGRQLMIKTKACQRLEKEVAHYRLEVVENRNQWQSVKDDPTKDEYDAKRYQDIWEESLRMVPDAQRRLTTALEDLASHVEQHFDDETAKDNEWLPVARDLLSKGLQNELVDDGGVGGQVTSVDDLPDGEDF